MHEAYGFGQRATSRAGTPNSRPLHVVRLLRPAGRPLGLALSQCRRRSDRVLGPASDFAQRVPPASVPRRTAVMAKRKAVHARTARGSAPGDLSRVVSADGDHSHAALSGAAAQRRDSGNSISSAAGNSSLLLNRSLGSRSDGSLRGEKPEAYRRMPPMGSHLAAPSPPRHSFTHGEPDDSAFPLIGHAVSHASSASRDASSPMSSMLSVDSSSIIASSMSEGASATAGAASASSQDTSLEEPSRRGSTTSARRRKAQLLRKTELCAAWQVGACPISAGTKPCHAPSLHR